MKMHVKINESSFAVDTTDQIRAAQRFMIDAMVPRAAVLDSDGDETGDTLPDECDNEAWALAAHLKVPVYTVGYGSGTGKYRLWEADGEPGEYIVVDESDCDTLWEEWLDNYIDECILDQLPMAYRDYFDRERWIDDAKHDGAGHILASYDGHEHEQKIDGKWYFIYRVN